MAEEIQCPKRTVSLFILLWKESSNSDGQQFHKYQQNKHSPLTKLLSLTACHWTQIDNNMES